MRCHWGSSGSPSINSFAEGVVSVAFYARSVTRKRFSHNPVYCTRLKIFGKCGKVYPDSWVSICRSGANQCVTFQNSVSKWLLATNQNEVTAIVKSGGVRSDSSARSVGAFETKRKILKGE